MAEHHSFSPEEMEEGIQYLQRLKEKYEGIGQDFTAYLEGLVQSNGLGYWDYIHLNSLLGLQSPRTNHPDELIFIVYHQITELYFKLIKHEIEQLTDPEKREYEDLDKWYLRIGRLVNYWKQLVRSFSVMREGMEPDQFRQFRMALLPASGFQSVQMRHIEIMSTNLSSLLQPAYRDLRDQPLEKLYDFIYWKKGGVELESGKKTLTLQEFEAKYDKELQQWIQKYQFRNLYYRYFRLEPSMKQDQNLIELLRSYDEQVNVLWRLSHLGSAAHYLIKAGEGTGGTNWRAYLPPRFQRIVFFDSLWSEKEKEEWGKAAFTKATKEG